MTILGLLNILLTTHPMEHILHRTAPRHIMLLQHHLIRERLLILLLTEPSTIGRICIPVFLRISKPRSTPILATKRRLEDRAIIAGKNMIVLDRTAPNKCRGCWRALP
jgi:hypothetical protein